MSEVWIHRGVSKDISGSMYDDTTTISHGTCFYYTLDGRCVGRRNSKILGLFGKKGKRETYRTILKYEFIKLTYWNILVLWKFCSILNMATGHCQIIHLIWQVFLAFFHPCKVGRPKVLLPKVDFFFFIFPNFGWRSQPILRLVQDTQA